jgi:hypothetical protein
VLGVAVSTSSPWRTKRESTYPLRRRPTGRMRPPGHAPAGQDERPRGCQRAPELGQRTVPDQVEHDVVPPSVPGEVLPGVVHDVVRAERPDQVHVSRTAHAGHEREPVSEWERHRNVAIYARQGNRNAFIDHPEWAGRCPPPARWPCVASVGQGEMECQGGWRSFSKPRASSIESGSNCGARCATALCRGRRTRQTPQVRVGVLPGQALEPGQVGRGRQE